MRVYYLESRNKWDYKPSSEDDEASSRNSESDDDDSEEADSEDDDENGSDNEAEVQVPRKRHSRVPERRQPSRRRSAAVKNLRESTESEGENS